MKQLINIRYCETYDGQYEIVLNFENDRHHSAKVNNNQTLPHALRILANNIEHDEVLKDNDIKQILENILYKRG